MELFNKSDIAGVFKGFSKGGMEFHADIALPYKEKLHNIPMHGQFLIVQLENPNEAVLGRICSMSAEGKLASASGEQYSIRAVDEGRDIPEQLKTNYLKYRVDIRVLGVVRIDNNKFIFAPSHRRLPHVGSPVAFLSDEILKEVCGSTSNGADIGHLALGEYVYSAGDQRAVVENWHQVVEPNVTIKFPIENLVSRRTFVFARAGYGKSNLNKLLFKNLYEQEPTVTKRDGSKVPVGTIIFDPDGEYFWPDDNGRPGLCDVPELKDKVVVFTSRESPSPFYDSFVCGQVKLDIRDLNPSDVISIALSPDKQDQQNVRKLRGLSPKNWSELVDLIDKHRNNADDEQVRILLHLKDGQDAELNAARANMTAIIAMLHDKTSQLMPKLIRSLSDGKLCVIDISQMRGGPSLMLAGLVLRRIFQHNQREFTKSKSKSIPTIAVIEEAQSVLNSNSSSSEPFIEWVKEGRKYNLGAFLVTQQPGSISTDILSQGDNWFIFHLLSETDLKSARSANAHFSSDMLSSLLNEPIKGQGVFWSSTGTTIYPIPIRAMSFESEVQTQDPTYSKAKFETYASDLRASYKEIARSLISDVKDVKISDSRIEPGDEFSPAFDEDDDNLSVEEENVDVRTALMKLGAKAIFDNQSLINKMKQGELVTWGYLWVIAKNAIEADRASANIDLEDVKNIANESRDFAVSAFCARTGMTRHDETRDVSGKPKRMVVFRSNA